MAQMAQMAQIGKWNNGLKPIVERIINSRWNLWHSQQKKACSIQPFSVTLWFKDIDQEQICPHK
jgi:hypothetical protein